MNLKERIKLRARNCRGLEKLILSVFAAYILQLTAYSHSILEGLYCIHHHQY